MTDIDDENDVFDANQIKSLVNNISKSNKKNRTANDGGQTREKYTCKCCGARVDSGVHKCSGCTDAGCEYGESKCGFN